MSVFQPPSLSSSSWSSQKNNVKTLNSGKVISNLGNVISNPGTTGSVLTATTAKATATATATATASATATHPMGPGLTEDPIAWIQTCIERSQSILELQTQTFQTKLATLELGIAEFYPAGMTALVYPNKSPHDQTNHNRFASNYKGKSHKKTATWGSFDTKQHQQQQSTPSLNKGGKIVSKIVGIPRPCRVLTLNLQSIADVALPVVPLVPVTLATKISPHLFPPNNKMQATATASTLAMEVSVAKITQALDPAYERRWMLIHETLQSCLRWNALSNQDKPIMMLMFCRTNAERLGPRLANIYQQIQLSLQNLAHPLILQVADDPSMTLSIQLQIPPETSNPLNNNNISIGTATLPSQPVSAFASIPY